MNKDKYLKKVVAYDRKYLQLEEELDVLSRKATHNKMLQIELEKRKQTLETNINLNQALIEEYKDKELALKALNFHSGFEGSLETLTNNLFYFQ